MRRHVLLYSVPLLLVKANTSPVLFLINVELNAIHVLLASLSEQGLQLPQSYSRFINLTTWSCKGARHHRTLFIKQFRSLNTFSCHLYLLKRHPGWADGGYLASNLQGCGWFKFKCYVCRWIWDGWRSSVWACASCSSWSHTFGRFLSQQVL